MSSSSDPAGQSRRVGWAHARELSYAAAVAGVFEKVGLKDANGRRLAEDVVALCDLPHYVSSAMDGWAVAGSAPWRVVDSAAIAPGECRPIVTGAVLPQGATAVLRSEHALLSDATVTTTRDARPHEPRDGEHIRQSGTEAQSGETLIPAGTLLNPAHIALAASAGHDELFVARLPRVRLVLTGDEVVPSGIPASGQVRDSFGPVLPSVVASLGGAVTEARHLRDSLPVLIEALSSDAADHDLTITTGGTGSSSSDHLRRALTDLGATILIDGIRMRPGGPSLLARFDDGRFVIGLPGNPLAAILGLLTIGQPLLAAMTGAPAPLSSPVRVGSDVAGRAGSSLLVPYRLEDGLAVAVQWSGSSMMRGLAESVGVLVCPPSGAAAGSELEAFKPPWV